MVLLQIVTGLPPLVDGIGDYARPLARRLMERHGLKTVFVVCNDKWKPGPANSFVDGFEAVGMESRSVAGLFNALETAEQKAGTNDVQLLLHYSGYGYAKRGAPFWLVRACRQWLRSRPGTWNVVFHELAVNDAPVWNSGYWMAPMQRWICGQLASLATFQITNSALNQRKLKAWSGREIPMLANCSTMPEPATLPPFDQRSRDVIVFGRPDHRKLTYDRAPDVLTELCARLGSKRILDVGPRIASGAPVSIGPVPVEAFGKLPAEEVSELMSQATASFSSYPPSLLGKSSTFHVATSHGTIPFVFDPALDTDPPSEFRPMQDFVPIGPDRILPSTPDLAAFSRSVYEGYQAHSSRALADRIYEGLTSTNTPGH